MNKTQILDKARTADVLVQIFTLLIFPAAQNETAAAELIRTLDPTAKRDLRSVAGRIDDLLDEIALNRLNN
jgi:hypothetical protein